LRGVRNTKNMKERVHEIAFKIEGARLSLKSVVLLLATLGLTAGILWTGVLFIVAGDIQSKLLVLFLGPIFSALNGALAGLLGYPIYQWMMNRYFSLSLEGFSVGGKL